MNGNMQPEIMPESNEPSAIAKFFKELGSWVICIVVAVAIALVLRNYVFTVVRVDGRSMMPTLEHNQRLFTRIIGYEPERGDVIIFHPQGDPEIAYVKRIIATEGDRIWIDDATGDVHLKKSGSDEWVILEEDYIANETYNPNMPNIAQRITDDSGEKGLLIEKDHIFVMGDNRNHSKDSRNGSEVGQVHVDSIIGKAVFRWWPLSDFGGIY
ncbi:MAG: signal peptidase I [Clostridia bacterium]|nr:signal peptidase I [Clostridia bacterium]